MAAPLLGGYWYQSSFASMESLFQAVQHAAFAQGFSVRRARTTRERKPGQPYTSDSPFNRIEIWCRCAGRSLATQRKSHKIKTNCPFKAIGTMHRGPGEEPRWLLRVIDGTHNHAPDPDLVDDTKFRNWFRSRLGGAYELETLVGIARMAAVPQLAAAPPPPPPPPQQQPPQPQPQRHPGEQLQQQGGPNQQLRLEHLQERQQQLQQQQQRGILLPVATTPAPATGGRGGQARAPLPTGAPTHAAAGSSSAAASAASGQSREEPMDIEPDSDEDLSSSEEEDDEDGPNGDRRDDSDEEEDDSESD